MESKVFNDGVFFEQVATKFAKFVKTALGRRERFSLVLSGGTTPRGLYEVLTSEKFSGKVDWSRIDFFFGDERDVSPMSEKSNFRMADELLFAPLSIPKTQIFRWQTEIIQVAEVASSYERTLRRYFGLAAGELPVFDLIFLGLGSDGHTASLFPFTEALGVTDRIAVANRVEKFDSNRLTLTYPVINNARCIFFIVTGSSKAAALREVLEGPRNCPKFPAQCIEPASGDLKWFVASSAAGKLSEKAAGK